MKKTSNWITFVIVHVAFMGIWGALVEIPEKNGFPATLGFVVWAISMIPAAVVGLFYRKWKIETDLRSILLGSLAGILGAVGQLVLFFTLRIAPAYIVFPLLSLTPVVTILLAVVFLKEKTGSVGWIGIGVAVAAIFLLSYQPSGDNGFVTGNSWMLLASIPLLAWGAQGFVMRFANETMKAESIFFYMMATSVLLIPAALLMTDFSQHINWGFSGPYLAGMIQLLNAFGALFLVYAFRYGKAIIVAPMTTALSPVITVVLSLAIYTVIPHPLIITGMLLAIYAAYLMGVAEMKKENEADCYAVDDFKKVEKIDVHVHVNTLKEDLIEQAVEDNFIFVSINVDAFADDPIEKQQEYALAQQAKYPDRFFYLTTFRMNGFEDAGWADAVIAYLEESFANGAVGVKVWKNIGMDEKTSDGKLIAIDDPMFDGIISFLKERNMPLTGHLGEPKSCWQSLEEMTIPGDRDYFSKNPEYHMYLHPELPSYDEQIEARDNMLEKNPDLVFVGAHLGSLEWSVDELAKRLDAFPLMVVDLAERICHFQYQSVKNWQKVYDFIVKYQDRLLYGTDFITLGSEDAQELKQRAHEMWMRDWIYFNTDGEMSSPRIDQKFRGLKLPKGVVDKIYSKNAKRIYLRNI